MCGFERAEGEQCKLFPFPQYPGVTHWEHVNVVVCTKGHCFKLCALALPNMAMRLTVAAAAADCSLRCVLPKKPGAQARWRKQKPRWRACHGGEIGELAWQGSYS